MFSKNSYIEQTGQKWKWRLSVILMIASCLFLVAGFIGLNRGPDGPSVPLLLVGALFGVFAVCFVALAFRCPQCRTNLGWKTLNDKWPLFNATCPVCDLTKEDGAA